MITSHVKTPMRKELAFVVVWHSHSHALSSYKTAPARCSIIGEFWFRTLLMVL